MRNTVPVPEFTYSRLLDLFSSSSGTPKPPIFLNCPTWFTHLATMKVYQSSPYQGLSLLLSGRCNPKSIPAWQKLSWMRFGSAWTCPDVEVCRRPRLGLFCPKGNLRISMIVYGSGMNLPS
jgi:hypothetical protein